MSKHLALALDDTRPLASTDRLLSVLEAEELSSQQERALAKLATSRDRFIGIHGVAGSGKSTLVRALVAAVDADVRVQALAPTSSAAAELGKKAKIPSQTVMNLIVSGGRQLDAHDLLVVDEAGQLSNRQALRLLELSRDTGARILFLGDNKQTGAIEQGKAFWLLQELGLPKAELPESLRQQNNERMMKAVKEARLGEYARAIGFLDCVVSGDKASKLAKNLVDRWMQLTPEMRASTNILVLDNATRITVNANVRRGLQKEGVIGREEVPLKILAPAGLSSEERRMARLYSKGQVVMFNRDVNKLGIVRQAEYAVVGFRKEESGREVVGLEDQQGRIILWDPRRTRATMVSVFNVQDRGLAAADRIQWRLATKELGLKNAERGTVERLENERATIRWDRGEQQEIDLSKHKTWDHGYAETVYSSQSKTYPRVFVLAPVDSPLVTGQNFYTAITRAESGVTLWTENRADLVEKLKRNSGQKTSSLEGLDLIKPSGTEARLEREAARIQKERDLFDVQRRGLALRRSESRGRDRGSDRKGLAGAGLRATETLTALIERVLRNQSQPEISQPKEPDRTTEVRLERGRDR
ncbi:ATP-dependent DNA helicase [Sphingobium sp. EP60837]|uniref:ATP-dependent DNA helicase n=1 Tax=Sphingobium sp. EP60837 TaxID=1855519 RepID=UPI003FA6C2FE